MNASFLVLRRAFVLPLSLGAPLLTSASASAQAALYPQPSNDASATSFSPAMEAPKRAAPLAKFQGSRVGLETDLWSAREEASLPGATLESSYLALNFAVVAQLELSKHAFIDAEVPFAYTSLWMGYTGGASRVRVGNEASGFVFGQPSLGAHYAANSSPDLAYFVGGTITAPTLADPSTETLFRAATALRARAFFDMHRFFVKHVPVRLRAGLECKSGPLRFRTDMAPMVAIPLDGAEAEVLIDHGTELELRAEGGFGGGLRFQETFMLTTDNMVQTAVEPFIGYEAPNAGLYARLGFLVALDEGAGFGLEEGKVATGRLQVGAKF